MRVEVEVPIPEEVNPHNRETLVHWWLPYTNSCNDLVVNMGKPPLSDGERYAISLTLNRFAQGFNIKGDPTPEKVRAAVHALFPHMGFSDLMPVVASIAVTVLLNLRGMDKTES